MSHSRSTHVARGRITGAFTTPAARSPINRTVGAVTAAGVMALTAGGAVALAGGIAPTATNPAVFADRSAVFGVDQARVKVLPAPAPAAPAAPPHGDAQAPAPQSQGDRQADQDAAAQVHVDAPADSIAAAALRYVGHPYRYGASGPTAFDCSGFTAYVYAQFGITLPHSSHAQGRMGRAVSAAQAQPGDLVYFSKGHVGIYLGNGRMVHASSPRTGVIVTPVSYSGAGQFRSLR